MPRRAVKRLSNRSKMGCRVHAAGQAGRLSSRCPDLALGGCLKPTPPQGPPKTRKCRVNSADSGRFTALMKQPPSPHPPPCARTPRFRVMVTGRASVNNSCTPHTLSMRARIIREVRRLIRALINPLSCPQSPNHAPTQQCLSV